MTNLKLNNTFNSWQEEFPYNLANDRVNILIVDDLREKQLVYQTILQELDQNIFCVSSGSEALKLVLKYDFAVILLDVNMPEMDGFEVATMILKRKKSSRTPIIFLTAFTDDIYTAQGYASGAVDYLPTPVVPTILRAKIRVFIELYQMRIQAVSQTKERVKRLAAEEAARRAEFLANASVALARSNNKTEVISELLKSSTSNFFDVSILWLKNDETQTEKADNAFVGIREHSHFPLTLPLSSLLWLQEAISIVLETGNQLIRDFPEIAIAPGINDINQKTIVQIGSVLFLPLSMRGQTLGVLTLAQKHPVTKFQSDKITLGNDLASRASVALQNIMLMETIQESDRRKDEFFIMLAHELRNPLSPILNATHLLKFGGQNRPDYEQILEIISRQVKHMVRLIDDLIDAKRLVHGKIILRNERCDLSKIVKQTAEDYQSIFKNNKLQLDIKVPDKSVWIEGDSTRLTQAIGNLLHNAHKFTNPGGQVKICLEANKDDNAYITVTDSGIGIEPKLLTHVFDIFRQGEQGIDRNKGGLGLGLALVKGLIELHNGNVSVKSAGRGKGTEFTLVLPSVKIATEIDISSANGTSIHHSIARRILVIEDNNDAAEVTKLMLSFEGHDVQIANSGLEGITAAKTFHPDVILCDIGLPEMDGYQVVHTIRNDKDLSSIYIIALTGYGTTNDKRKCYEAGFDMHLTKPIPYINLHQILANLPDSSN